MLDWVARAPKIVEPGPLEISLNPKVSSHNANSATGGFCSEIQVETNNELVFPFS
ncbi:MAG: hypothetical protein QG670_2363 [Thermoproteota archaeon]|nr:hypothetical protein [Thermoproteota archaeon]